MRRTRKGLLSYITAAITLILSITGAVLGGIALAFLSWIVAGVSGYLMGLVLNFFFGTIIVEGLNIIFNTKRFLPEMLPYMTTTLAVFSNFVKPFVNINPKS